MERNGRYQTQMVLKRLDKCTQEEFWVKEGESDIARNTNRVSTQININ